MDKPPVALWIQTISARIFGFNSLSLLAPEALAGVASVAIIYFLVRRVFGTLAGFVAALALAFTPIAVAVERTNNTDSFLMLTLLLAAWALIIASEKGRLAHLMLALGLVGVGFNIKMLAAFVVLPAFYLFIWWQPRCRGRSGFSTLPWAASCCLLWRCPGPWPSISPLPTSGPGWAEVSRIACWTLHSTITDWAV